MSRGWSSFFAAVWGVVVEVDGSVGVGPLVVVPAGVAPLAAAVDDDAPFALGLGDDAFALPGDVEDDRSCTAAFVDPRRLDSRSCDDVKSMPREERTVLRMMFSQTHTRCKATRSWSGFGAGLSRDWSSVCVARPCE